MEKQYSGWARNKFLKCKTYTPKSLSDLRKLKNCQFIPRGMGRSYGDSSLKKDSILLTKNLNKILKLDLKKKIIEDKCVQIMREVIFLLIDC